MDGQADDSPREAIALRIKELLVEVLHLKKAPSEIDDALPLDTLGLDSLNIVDILLGLERMFDLTVDEAELDFSMLESVESLTDFVLAGQRRDR